MNSISDHHLKTKGVSAFKTALEHHQVATIYADGQARFVVIAIEHYHYLRECELSAAVAEMRADLKAGRYIKESPEHHLQRLEEISGD